MQEMLYNMKLIIHNAILVFRFESEVRMVEIAIASLISRKKGACLGLSSGCVSNPQPCLDSVYRLRFNDVAIPTVSV